MLYTADRDTNLFTGESWPSVHTWSPRFTSLRILSLSFEKHKDPRIMSMWPGWSTNRETKGYHPLVSYDESPTHTDNRISQGETLGSTIHIISVKSRGTTPWRVTTSQRLGQMTGSPIHNFKSQGEILHSNQVRRLKVFIKSSDVPEDTWRIEIPNGQRRSTWHNDLGIVLGTSFC